MLYTIIYIYILRCLWGCSAAKCCFPLYIYPKVLVRVLRCKMLFPPYPHRKISGIAGTRKMSWPWIPIDITVTGWWFQLFWKILISWEGLSHIYIYILKNKKCSKPPTRYCGHDYNTHKKGGWLYHPIPAISDGVFLGLTILVGWKKTLILILRRTAESSHHDHLCETMAMPQSEHSVLGIFDASRQTGADLSTVCKGWESVNFGQSTIK